MAGLSQVLGREAESRRVGDWGQGKAAGGGRLGVTCRG